MGLPRVAGAAFSLVGSVVPRQCWRGSKAVYDEGKYKFLIYHNGSHPCVGVHQCCGFTFLRSVVLGTLKCCEMLTS